MLIYLHQPEFSRELRLQLRVQAFVGVAHDHITNVRSSPRRVMAEFLSFVVCRMPALSPFIVLPFPQSPLYLASLMEPMCE